MRRTREPSRPSRSRAGVHRIGMVYLLLASLSGCSGRLLARHPNVPERRTAACLAASAAPAPSEALDRAVASCIRTLGAVPECDPSGWMSAEAARCIGERAFAAEARAGLEATPVFRAKVDRMVWSLKGTWPGKPCAGSILQIDATDGALVGASGFLITHRE